MRYQDKFITMKKVFRLACYKQHKESKPERNQPKTIAQVCPYKFTEIQEACKHCRWFQMVDETKPIKQQIIDSGITNGEQIKIKLEDFDELPYEPKTIQALPE
ncbi:hypothetical protein LCGC14_0901060 [marine sediment metagenome]|uniref:Uncharacterized protein n=1 Tax=marine sediment metagenome TaxID=412755 RepID=A0A0F9PH69_9ZZZZ